MLIEILCPHHHYKEPFVCAVVDAVCLKLNRLSLSLFDGVQSCEG